MTPTWVEMTVIRPSSIGLQKNFRRREAKIELSGVQEAKGSLSFITADVTGPRYFEESFFRAKFEQSAVALISLCRTPVE